MKWHSQVTQGLPTAESRALTTTLASQVRTSSVVTNMTGKPPSQNPLELHTGTFYLALVG